MLQEVYLHLAHQEQLYQYPRKKNLPYSNATFDVFKDHHYFCVFFLKTSIMEQKNTNCFPVSSFPYVFFFD